ncbi:MAG: M23 family metallopeptidase [Alphaproteobacteria bacterium]|nr:M23 family metallopeptidase [Alphaproteobacteria bacterium]
MAVTSAVPETTPPPAAPSDQTLAATDASGTTLPPGATTATASIAQMVEARPGDSPLRLLTRVGVAPDDAHAAIRKLRTVWNPRDLKAGQKAAVLVQSDKLLSVRLALAPDRDIVVARDDTGGFVAEDQNRPTHDVQALGSGTINTSLSGAASRAGVPAAVLDEMIRAFSYDVDFQREVKAGDSFTVLYDRVDDEFDHPTSRGHLEYAEMVLKGVRLRLYRFTPKDGEPGYFNALGENIRKSLLRTPIDGARITSGFGMRFHPILGYSRMHKGVDFGAPIGTAVYAAGDGVVARAGQVSGYGNYIELQHNAQYATAYGHLSAFANGLHQGEHVRQGDVIGYVGMTGMATGPHLHYEVHYDGVQIDPQSVKMPALTRLAGDDLRAFQAARSGIEKKLNGSRPDLVAGMQCRPGLCGVAQTVSAP